MDDLPVTRWNRVRFVVKNEASSVTKCKSCFLSSKMESRAAVWADLNGDGLLKEAIIGWKQEGSTGVDACKIYHQHSQNRIHARRLLPAYERCLVDRHGREMALPSSRTGRWDNGPTGSMLQTTMQKADDFRPSILEKFAFDLLDEWLCTNRGFLF
jgi:hypothetical protein